MSTLLPGNIIYAGPSKGTEAQNYRSLGHYVLEILKGFGNKTMMIDAVTGKEYTAKFMYDSIVRLAYCLQELNVESGDVVSLCSENCIEFVITAYACFAINATVAPLNATYSERELDHAINLSKPKVIFASELAIHRVTKVAMSNKFVKNIVVFGNTKPTPNCYAFRDLMESKTITFSADFSSGIENNAENVALILCSSGTTGMPKGVQITQSNIFAALDSPIEITEITALSISPWFHSYGFIVVFTCNFLGATLIYLPKFEEKLFLGAIEKYRVLLAFMVPPLMVFLAKHPIVDNYDLSSLKILICGAAPLGKNTEDQIKQRIVVPIIRQGYGLSETTRGVLSQTDGFCKSGSVGVLKLGIYAKVIDTNTGKALGPHTRGELCFKGNLIMKGYIGDAESTQTVINDGWLHTGDIGYYDEDFEFFIVDRIKELIKYKGFQVPPAEIESLLLTHPKVKDVAVIGKEDEEAGELPMAFVVKQENVELTEEEVIQYVAERTSSAKRLRGGVRFVDEIPKNPSGKILRRVLRDMLLKELKSKL